MSETNRQSTAEERHSWSRNARNGIILFAIYLALYGGFVLLNVFAPSLMEVAVWGISLAVSYGLALIVAAFVLALVYVWLCRASRTQSDEGPSQ